MKTAKVVIGANFGDEGKGLLTDFLSTESDLVVRFNGGAQAGHTVEHLRERHVFSHVGSGTMNGVPTYLSRHFVANPILLRRELNELQAKGYAPKIITSVISRVTTPWDMMVNQFVETARGDHRHGSVGVGFHETVLRCGFVDMSLNVFGLMLPRANLVKKLELIRDSWVAQRVNHLGLVLSEEQRDLVYDPGVMTSFLDDIDFFLASVTRARGNPLDRYDHILFEGAQGLMLDQDHGAFPYVTHSSTGMKNVVSLIDGAVDTVDVHYVTRSYLTRHGAGPLEDETAAEEVANIVDTTNVPNDWQGALRVAPLDIAATGRFIQADLDRNRTSKMCFNPSLAMTCCDQLQGDAPALLHGLFKATGIPAKFASYGPTRFHIGQVQDTRAA